MDSERLKFNRLLELSDSLSLLKAGDPVKDALLKASTILATQLKSCPADESVLTSLANTPPPRSPALLDEPALVAAEQLLAICAIEGANVIGPAVLKANGMGPAHLNRLAGLSAYYLSALTDLLNQYVVTELCEARLVDHSPRICAALEAIRFSRVGASHKNAFSCLDEAILSQLEQLAYCRFGIAGALRTLQLRPIYRSVFSQLQHSLDSQASVTLVDFRKSLEHVKRVIRFVYYPINSQDVCIDLSISPSSGLSLLSLESLSKEPESEIAGESEALGFVISPDQEIILADSNHRIPLSDRELSKLFSDPSDAIFANDFILEVANEVVRQFDKLKSDVAAALERINELPPSYFFEIDEGAITIGIAKEHVASFLALYSHLDGFEEIGEEFLQRVAMSEDAFHFFRFGPSEKSTSLEGFNDQTISLELTHAESIRAELDLLLRKHFHNFGQLFDFLKRTFNVTLSNQGKGDHKTIHRGTYPFTLSPEYRNPAKPLHYPITFKLLAALRITHEEMIEALKHL